MPSKLPNFRTKLEKRVGERRKISCHVIKIVYILISKFIFQKTENSFRFKIAPKANPVSFVLLNLKMILVFQIKNNLITVLVTAKDKYFVDIVSYSFETVL